MAFETADPRGGPKLHVRAEAVGEVGLRRPEIRQRPFFLVVKLLPNEGAMVQLEAENRRISDHRIRAEQLFVRGNPIVNDRDVLVISKAEEIVQRSGDHHVQIDEEADAFKRQIRPEQADFPPARNHFRWREIDFRNRENCDRGVDARSIIREANDGDRRLRMAADGGCQSVHILGSIAGSPFESDDVAVH